MRTLIAPYGGKLSILYISGDILEAERQRAVAYPSWDLTERQSLGQAEITGPKSTGKEPNSGRFHFW